MDKRSARGSDSLGLRGSQWPVHIWPHDMRILLLAKDCNPQWPSLPGVGFKAARAIADHAEVVVATYQINRAAIEAEGFGDAEPAYIDNEYVAAPMYRLGKLLRGGRSVGWTTNVAMAYLPYIAFERQVWRRFGPDLKAGRFDIVHRITPMSPTLPSPMAKWSPVPFVIGPLNGGLKWPPGFSAELRREREWLTYLRSTYRLLPFSRRTFERSAAILASFRHTIEDLPSAPLDRVIDFPEVGIDPEFFASRAACRTHDQLQFMFVGRLVPYKCCDVAILAFARSRALRRHRLFIVGDGPERSHLEQLVAEHQLEETVTFLGWKTQEEVGVLMREADVFVFPSIRELGAGVVVEAMASGLACVVVDYGGPGGLIDPDRGIKVPLGTKTELIVRYVAALETLAVDRDRLRQLRGKARDFAIATFTWEAKARKILEVYQWVLGERNCKPEFWNTGSTVATATDESRPAPGAKIA